MFGLRQATVAFFIMILVHANVLAFLRLDVFLHVSLCFPHPDVTEAELRDVSFFDPNKDGSQK